MTNEFDWLDELEERNYAAAEDYLMLLYSDGAARAVAMRLRQAPISYFKVEDVFRAARLQFADVSKDVIIGTEKFSPVLLVRNNIALVIADGYRRVCAAYAVDPLTKIPCKIV